MIIFQPMVSHFDWLKSQKLLRSSSVAASERTFEQLEIRFIVHNSSNARKHGQTYAALLLRSSIRSSFREGVGDEARFILCSCFHFHAPAADQPKRPTDTYIRNGKTTRECREYVVRSTLTYYLITN